MDLSLNPQVEIYQIHQTPFFRRLHRNDSHQFERLKKAYESIRNFDDKPLQSKVNKVRLDKLVERIKESLTKSKLPQRNKPKSKQRIRFEELARARQVGNEYLRKNYNSTPRLSEQRNLNPHKELLMKTSQLNRRLEYGNQKSEKNRSKIQRSQGMLLTNNKGFCAFSTNTPTSAEKLRQLLVNYLSEDKPNPEIVKSFEEIAKKKNHLYWNLMGAIKKQHQYLKRYGKLTKRLSKLSMTNMGQHQYSCNVEVFNSKTNIKPQDSEILIRTYRYSDDDEYLPPPSESLLRIPPDLPDDVTDDNPTRDDFNNITDNLESIKHLHITFPNLKSNTIPFTLKVPEKKFDLSQKFGEIIRKTVRKESAIMLNNLEKAMKL